MRSNPNTPKAMAFSNPQPNAIRALLQKAHSIAVVGLSPNPRQPSYEVARALQEFGYRIIPVRPATEEVLGEKAYADLKRLPEAVDIVDVFRAPEDVDDIVNDCIGMHVPALWLQEGVVNESAAERAHNAGIFVVMNRCICKDYKKLLGT